MRIIAGAILVLSAAAHAQTFSTLWTFHGYYVSGAEASLVQGSDGNFYGTTGDGGAHGMGSVFKLTPLGTLTTLYSFGTAGNDGATPGPLVAGDDGNFYGTTQGASSGVGTFFQVTPAGVLTTLYSFNFAPQTGATPFGLIKGSDGNFYGMTQTSGPQGGGTIFRITAAGVLTTVYAFTPNQTANGLSGTLIQGSDGNFYGTTTTGGDSFAGSVFKLTPAGGLTTIYSFGAQATNPGPPAALLQASDGTLYGLTNPGDSVSGTIFRLTTGGNLTTVYNFKGQGNGANPTALVQGLDGNFYGLTATGGAGNSGTIFELTGGGALTTLHNFSYSTDGADAVTLIQVANGTLYGTANSGGAYGQGTIFSLTLPAGAVPTAPVINSVTNAFSSSPILAPNTWVAIKGANLAPPGESRTWQAADFIASQMPAELDNVSVTLNGEAAYIYYISGAQINILTPPDLAAGAVQVVVTNNGVASSLFTVQAQATSLAFFVFNGGPYVVGTHLDSSDLGPASLFPGMSSPAQPGELVVLYGNGFGGVSQPIVKGSELQSGELSPTPVILIGGTAAEVKFAGLISPGLYQFNVVVPMNAANGDNSIVAQYGGQSTQTGVLLTVGAQNPAKVASLGLSASTVGEGGILQATVTLTAPAPAGGALVSLSASSGAVSLPPTVTVPAGATSATFVIDAVSISPAVTVTATYQGISATAMLSVTG